MQNIAISLNSLVIEDTMKDLTTQQHSNSINQYLTDNDPRRDDCQRKGLQ